jgi:23S rRNA (uridine2552-2'-O)-methyltransferase
MSVRPRKKSLNRAWLHDHLTDPYVKRAQREGYRARAAYKLLEIDETLKLVRPGQVVVDLGAVPGAWSQYLRRRFAPEGAAQGQLDGSVIALDVLPFEPIEGVHFIQGDFREDGVVAELERVLAGRPVDLVVSDMAPNLSGVGAADAARMAHLVELAVDFALRHLRAEGALVAKAFHGSGYSQLVKLFKDSFRIVKPIKPKASRDRSSETFLVGIEPRADASSRARAESATRLAGGQGGTG